MRCGRRTASPSSRMRARTSTPSSTCSAARPARSSKRFAATRARRAIRRAPRTPTTWTSPPARWAWASRRRCSPRSPRITCARTAGDSTGPKGRMIALVGDAELDEGNIFEAMLEGWKHGLAELLVDHRLQPAEPRCGDPRRPVGALRGAVPGVRVGRRDPQVRLAAAGRLSASRAAKPCATGSTSCPNQLYSALVFQGGAAWRKRLNDDFADEGPVARLIGQRSDDELARLMTNLAGHDLPSLIEAFESRSTTTGRSASSATRSRASGFLSPGTRTTMPV